MEDLLQHGCGERLEVDTSRLASEKRLFAILEDFLHHIIDAATSDEVNAGFAMMLVPYLLNVADDTIANLVGQKYADEQCIDFAVEAKDLPETEREIAKVQGAWKVEFEKKADKNIFCFKALVTKGSDYETNLKEFCQNKGWNLVSFEIHNANLEEVFLKLAGEEEGVDK